MANTIIHKRNGTASSVPTTGQLTDGEIAINYYDGRMFFRRNVSGTLSVREVVTIDGTQTLSNKTLTTPVIGAATGTSLVLSAGLTVGDTILSTIDDNPTLIFGGRASHYRYLRFQTGTGGTPVRFDFGLNNTAESGSDAGSDFYISRFNDSNSVGAITMVIKRSNGYMCVGPAATTPTYAFEVAGSVNGDVYSRTYNGSSGNSAAAGFLHDLSSVSNAYVVGFLHKNSGSPYWRLSTGSGVTEGVYMDATNFAFRNQAVSKVVMNLACGTNPVVDVYGADGLDSFRVRGTYGTSKFLTMKPETSTNVAQFGYWTGSSFGTLHLVGTMKYTCATWHLSDEGVGRLYYVSSGSTIYESGGTGDHQFRNSTDANIAHFDYYGNLIFDASGTGIYLTTSGLMYIGGNGSTGVALRRNGSGVMELVLGNQSDYADWVARQGTFGGAVKAKRFEFVNGVTTLGTSGTVTPTWTDNNYFRCTTSGNVTLAIGTAPPPGTYIVEVIYGGSHTLTVPAHNGSTIRWAGGAPPASTNTSGKIDIIQIVSDGTNVRMSMSLNY